jgi:hypothetical protein
MVNIIDSITWINEIDKYFQIYLSRYDSEAIKIASKYVEGLVHDLSNKIGIANKLVTICFEFLRMFQK